MIVEEAYLAGAGEVLVNFTDDVVSHHQYKYLSVEKLQDIPEWMIAKYQYVVDHKGALIEINAPL